jgi:hypothetical protein
MNLDQILNAVSIPLEVGDLHFRLTPFPNARVAAWNRASAATLPDDATDQQVLDLSEKVQAAQLDVIAGHMRDCITDGDAKKVTTKWVASAFPQTVLIQLASFFATGEKPEWAGQSGK